MTMDKFDIWTVKSQLYFMRKYRHLTQGIQSLT